MFSSLLLLSLLALRLAACSSEITDHADPGPDVGLPDAGEGPDGEHPDGGDDDGFGEPPDTGERHPDRLVIEGVEPSSGTVRGGTQVAISGRGLLLVRAVRFAEQEAVFQVVDDGLVMAVLPPAPSAGAADVVLESRTRVAVLGGGFIYQDQLGISMVEPSVLPVQGGVPVLVQGEGVDAATQVVIGASPLLAVVAYHGEGGGVRGVSPPGVAGEAAVWAFNPDEGSAARYAGRVTYVHGPGLERVVPRAAPAEGGAQVVVEGAGLGLGGEVQVHFGGVAAEVLDQDEDGEWVRVRVPAHLPGPVRVKVETPAGVASLDDGFIYFSPRTTGDGASTVWLDGVSPASGPLAGGTEVVVVGGGFSTGSSPEFSFERRSASCRPHPEQPDSMARCAVPARIPATEAGPVPVGVKDGDGRSFTLEEGFSYLATPALEAVSPREGPQEGGGAVTVSGSGFCALPRLFFGTMEAEVVGRDGDTGLVALVPPHPAGEVEVAVECGPGGRSRLRAGYRYRDGFEPQAVVHGIYPEYGSIAGNTAVQIFGAGLSRVEAVFLGSQPAASFSLDGSARLTVRTPPWVVDTVPVRLRLHGGTEVVAGRHFRYVDPSGGAGGVWGPPIDGALNVALLDSITGEPVEGALAILGSDPATPLQGFTDNRGMVTISTPELEGPVRLHVGKEGYEVNSVIDFNAENVLLFSMPLTPPPPPDGGGGLPPGGPFHGVVQGTIKGLDKYLGALDEYGEVEEGGNWVKAVRVETTRSSPYGGNPSPGPGGTIYGNGEYRINSRPGDVAIIALGGYLDTTTGTFLARSMGVARHLFVVAGEEHTGHDITLDIPLTGRMGVELLVPPFGQFPGTNEVRNTSFLVFEQEGYFGGWNDVRVERRDFWLPGLPQRLEGPLADTTFMMLTGVYRDGGRPMSVVWSYLDRIEPGSVIQVGPFASIPHMAAPREGMDMDAGRLVWEWRGGKEPDLAQLRVLDVNMRGFWRLFAPGGSTDVVLPQNVPGLPPLEPGVWFATFTAGILPGFSMDSFEYRHLSNRLYDSWSVAWWDFRQP